MYLFKFVDRNFHVPKLRSRYDLKKHKSNKTSDSFRC